MTQEPGQVWSGAGFTDTENVGSEPGSESVLERVARSAARLFRAKAAMLSLPDGDQGRQITYFNLHIEDASRLEDFCAETVRHGRVLAVPDAASDTRFKDHPAVVRPPLLRFFAGVPVPLSGTSSAGILCVMDDAPRPFGVPNKQRRALEDLARLAGDQMIRERRAKASNETQRSLALLQRAFEHSRDAILISQSEAHDPVGTPPKVLFANQAFYQMMGHGPELLGCKVPDLMVDGPEKEKLRRAFRNFEQGSAALLNQRRDGSKFLAEVEISPFSFEEDDNRYWISVRRETAEQSLVEMQALAQMAGGIAHDFNNLLTVINGYARMLARKLPAGSPLWKDVGALTCAGHRAISMTKQLLAISRNQHGEARVVNLNAIVEDLVPVLRDVLPANIDLQCRLGEKVPPVLANGSQMEQVVLNLVNNARDAMQRGGTLRVETRRVVPGEQDGEWAAQARPGEYALLTVKDTGSGMNQDVLSRLFEPFFTTKPKGSGTGLGLAQVSSAVRQSGGHIQVESELGSGSRFAVYLPGTRERNEATPESFAPVEEAPGAGNILLVEEDAEVRDYLQELLSSSGFRVNAWRSGENALAAHPKLEGVDLVVTSVSATERNGSELGEQLHAIRTEIPVVYVTAFPGFRAPRGGIVDPGDRVLLKPFTPEELLREVRLALSGKPSGVEI